MNKIDLKDILQENLADDNQDYLSILGDEKEMLNDHTDIPDTLPILPLRNTVLFPGRHNSYKYWQGKIIETHPLRV